MPASPTSPTSPATRAPRGPRAGTLFPHGHPQHEARFMYGTSLLLVQDVAKAALRQLDRVGDGDVSRLQETFGDLCAAMDMLARDAEALGLAFPGDEDDEDAGIEARPRERPDTMPGPGAP